MKNECIIFAGRKWKVINTYLDVKIISLEPSKGGMPRFTGTGGAFIHDEVAKQIKLLYRNTNPPCYLDPTAHHFYLEGQEHFQNIGLDDHMIILEDGLIYIFPWMGTKVCNTIALELQALSIPAYVGNPSCFVICESSAEMFIEALKTRIHHGKAEPVKLASLACNKEQNKYDYLLNDELLCHEYANRNLDTEKAFLFWLR